jgi:hypothetical protein
MAQAIRQPYPSAGEANKVVASKPSQTLGRWVDNLLGDKKARERAAEKADARRKASERTPEP